MQRITWSSPEAGLRESAIWGEWGRPSAAKAGFIAKHLRTT
jgi:hypothetical protein